MKLKIYKNPERSKWSALLKRPMLNIEDVEETATLIFNDVKRNGDKAILKYTSLFDGAQLKSMKVSSRELEEAQFKVSDNLKTAINMAKSNIEQFHLAQKTEHVCVETMPGVKCWLEKRAIDKIGLYIPGGTAPLFSTVLMLAIPAKIAGCHEIVLCSPPNRDGKIADEILYTASICGVKTIYKVGGIQAIAGLTFGSASIPKVYKIFGPGNQFVTAAKQLATKYNIAIDMPAGPSELMVVADDAASAEFVAADLLSQAEHGTDSQVVLVSTSIKLIRLVKTEISTQIEQLPRKAIAKKAILNSKFIFLETNALVLDLINEYAPEHLILSIDNEEFFTENIQNAGSVFIGNYTPESAGDYASGTNHTLPTNGFSKAYSGVNLDSFCKSITFQKITKEGLKNLGNTVELMAEAEGLDAHKNAISIRLKKLQNDNR